MMRLLIADSAPPQKVLDPDPEVVNSQQQFPVTLMYIIKGLLLKLKLLSILKKITYLHILILYSNTLSNLAVLRDEVMSSITPTQGSLAPR